MLFILFILIYPEDCVKAAANGLILWYENILPALLPFTIFSNILIQSGYLDDMVRAAMPVLNRLFFHHPQAAYPIIAGFLFGFPMGSRPSLWPDRIFTRSPLSAIVFVKAPGSITSPPLSTLENTAP